MDILTFAPFVQIALWILEKFFLKKGIDKESRKIFLYIAKELRAHGVEKARSIFESEETQIKDGEKYWDELENDKRTDA